MYNHITEYHLENFECKDIQYQDGEDLKLSKDFMFFHNKNKFRPELTRLQQLFNEYIKHSLHAPGIRDSYLNQGYSDDFLIVLVATMESHKEINKYIEELKDVDLKNGAFHLQISSEYILLLAKEMDGLKSGVDVMEEIFRETFEDYFKQKQFDDYIKIRQFKMINCRKKE